MKELNERLRKFCQEEMFTYRKETLEETLKDVQIDYHSLRIRAWCIGTQLIAPETLLAQTLLFKSGFESETEFGAGWGCWPYRLEHCIQLADCCIQP